METSSGWAACDMVFDLIMRRSFCHWICLQVKWEQKETLVMVDWTSPLPNCEQCHCWKLKDFSQDIICGKQFQQQQQIYIDDLYHLLVLWKISFLIADSTTMSLSELRATAWEMLVWKLVKQADRGVVGSVYATHPTQRSSSWATYYR